MQSTDKETCFLCNKQAEMIIENEHALAIYDTNPASNGHSLIIPHRHVAEYFQATPEEKLAMWELVDKMKIIIDKKHNPDAYNIGINVGKTAGQSVPHIHIHLIPRFKGDVEDPRGGVRGVIPAKRKYQKS